MNEICQCPTCKEPIDTCPHCKGYKPNTNKFCRDCFQLYQKDLDTLHSQFTALKEALDERYNYEPPQNPMDRISKNFGKHLMKALEEDNEEEED